MGCMIGAAGKTPVQVCETSWLTAARGVSCASTFGSLSLILPGASLARLAAKQADLLHSISRRVSSGAALQPSAGADSIYLPGPPIQLVQLITVPTPCRRTSRLQPARRPARPPRQCPGVRRAGIEGSSVTTIQRSLCSRWKTIGGGDRACVGDESDVPQLSSVTAPKLAPMIETIVLRISSALTVLATMAEQRIYAARHRCSARNHVFSKAVHA